MINDTTLSSNNTAVKTFRIADIAIRQKQPETVVIEAELREVPTGHNDISWEQSVVMIRKVGR